MNKKIFVPVTPGGTILDWLSATSEQSAWDKLLKDAEHMPYKTKENFIKRGYTLMVRTK